MTLGTITAHFGLAELTRSDVATRKGIRNVPDPGQEKALLVLATTILEPLRARFAAPVVITSGFRCPELNALIGSKPGSQHTKGEAADLHVPGVSHAHVAAWIRDNLPFDQLIAEFWSQEDRDAGWVHVSAVETPMRNQVLTVDRDGTRPGLLAERQ